MRRPWLLPFLAAALAVASCDLPGAAPPTPFVFPTPNQTLTAVFAPTATSEAPAPTETLVVVVPGTTAPTVITPGAGAPTATVGGLNTRPNGSVLEALWLASAPTIDGVLSDWAALPFSADKVVYGSSRWSGASDCSAVFALGWDTSNLYVAVRVTDDKYVQVASGDNQWKGDEVEIQFDADLASDFYTASLSADDHQIGLSAGNFGSISPQAYRWYPQAKSGSQATITVAGKTTTNGYELEARIPWTVLGVTPAERARYGFALSVSDNDQAATAVQQSMVSSVSTRKLLNPTTWGTLALGGSTPK